MIFHDLLFRGSSSLAASKRTDLAILFLRLSIRISLFRLCSIQELLIRIRWKYDSCTFANLRELPPFFQSRLSNTADLSASRHSFSACTRICVVANCRVPLSPVSYRTSISDILADPPPEDRRARGSAGGVRLGLARSLLFLSLFLSFALLDHNVRQQSDSSPCSRLARLSRASVESELSVSKRTIPVGPNRPRPTSQRITSYCWMASSADMAKSPRRCRQTSRHHGLGTSFRRYPQLANERYRASEQRLATL